MKAVIISSLAAVVLALAALSWVILNPARSLTVQVFDYEPEFEAMLASAPRELQDFRIYRSSDSSRMWMFSTVAGSAAEADRRIDELEGFVHQWQTAVTAGHWLWALETGPRIDGHWDGIRSRHSGSYEPYPPLH